MTDIFAPNTEDEHGPYWDAWDALGVNCGGYGGDVDADAIAVLEGIRDKLYVTDIAARTGLAESHVELWQYLFCSADWCEYGTSPRGCWFAHDKGENFGERLIAAWREYYQRHWKQSPK